MGDCVSDCQTQCNQEYSTTDGQSACYDTCNDDCSSSGSASILSSLPSVSSLTTPNTSITSSSGGTDYLAMGVSALATYHGYKRDDSIFWAVVWGALGFMFPLPVGVIALAQGIGTPKKS